jgi:hypothetical protein
MWECGRVKGQPQGSLGGFYRARRGGGPRPEAMATNGHGGRRS